MTNPVAPGRKAGYASALEKRLQANVRRFLLDNAMLPPDGRIVVAVSGGADSTALLLILARLAKTLRLTLHVAHFDHGLRGEDAAQHDEASVRELARSLCLPLRVGHGDVRATARRDGLSLEDAARRERYAFLARVATETGASAVATGHTASDQAETVLLHLVRGSGLAGLAGMSAKTAWPFAGHEDLSLIRPLLRLSRDDTLAYCDAACMRPLDDKTNASPDYRRNRVRNEVLPLLRELNPRIDDALVRLAGAAAEDEAYIDASASRALKATDGTFELPRELLAGWETSPRRHALRLALQRLGGDVQDFSERHLVALERLVIDGKTGDRLDLPRHVSAELTRSSLLLRLGEDTRAALPEAPVALLVPGEARFGPLILAVSTDQPAIDCSWVEVDAEAVAGGLRVRRRRPGDRFQPLGMREEKKLQDFLVDAHIARARRDTLPLFESSRGIAWVGGLRIAEWAQPRPGRATLFLSFRSVD